MREIRALHDLVKPVETLFVVDAMTGQDAANTAKAFGDALPLTGVVLTKTDGDARGGAALSVRHVTGKPLKFVGVSEKLDGLEPFHPERMAQRVLGMGDIVSLVEQAQKNIDIAEKPEAGREDQVGQQVRPERFPRSARPGEEAGRHGFPAGKAARPVPAGRRPVARRPGREAAAPHGAAASLRLLTAAERAASPGTHQGLAQASYRSRLRCVGTRGQSPAESVRANARHDEADEKRRHGLVIDARCGRHEGSRFGVQRR